MQRMWTPALLSATVVFLMQTPVNAVPQGAVTNYHVQSLESGASVGISKGDIPSLHTITVSHVQRRVPNLSHGAIGRVPFMTRFGAERYAAMKAAAAHNPNAPGAFFSAVAGAAQTPPILRLLTGMTDNGIVCGYFGSGCQPPDMAVAASPNWTVQATNTSVAVFDQNGVMVLGYPVDFATFFGVPNSCHGYPFTSDPRAVYDPNDHRFFIAINAANGVADTCHPSSRAYVAVSQTSDPSFGWNVYSVNSALADPNDFNDFTELGFDNRAVYFGGNQFPCCAAGFDGAWTIIWDKKRMEAGLPLGAPNIIGPYHASSSPTCPGGGCLLDTVHPTTSVATVAQQPEAKILVSADQSSPRFFCGFGVTCRNIDVFAIADPLSSPVVSMKTVVLPAQFVFPPAGDEPGCVGCLETSDNRISGAPTYSPSKGGTVSFGFETGVRFGFATFPGFVWGVLKVKELGDKLVAASLMQTGTIAQSNTTNSFPATQLTPSGDLFIVSDVMSASTYPGWVYRVQRAGDPSGSLRAPRGVQPGLNTFLPFGPGLRWGDYEATSYDGFSTNNVWLASQYGNTNYDWGTSMAKVH